ncbi:MAG: serine/threonine protein kinase [Phycisphaerales bacterium]|nr:serine/threonine protein kinase [Phycisphaerales bacterium]
MGKEGCLSKAAIEAIAFGEQPQPSVQHHIEGCAACRAALEEVREINQFLARFAPHRGEPTGGQYPEESPAPASPGSVQGYEGLEEIHRGGQGVVYRAIQQETRRTVAIKMLLSGADASPRQRERFEREMRMAAGLRHPNIVTVYGGGRLSGGRFAYAMEYIDGLRLDRWSHTLDQATTRDARRRALRTRLAAFIKVCDAVLCAHQHAIVHRDLKPANILVDPEGEPHVLDFGIASTLDPESGDTRLTHTGEFAGTFAYASPEQVSGDPRRVGTPTDIYSLGVILYQLVSGRMPYPVDGPISQVIRNIEIAQPGPLTGQTVPPGQPYVDGEVETIAAKALAKDPARRYPTVAALRDDIARYLAGEPIDAKRDSTWYVLRKTVSRHRLAVAAAFAVFLMISTFGIVMARQARRIAAERDIATAESDRARSVTDFVVGSLISQDPNQSGTHGMTVADAMTQAIEGLRRGDLGAQPETRAVLLRTIAEILNGNGRSDEAEPPAREALQTEESLHAGAHPHVAASLDNLAFVIDSLGRPAEAEPLYERALQIRRALHHGDDQDVAAAINSLAGVRDQLGDPGAAEKLYVEALEMNRRLFKGDHPFVASAINNLAYIRQELGKSEDAENLFRESLDMTRRIYPGDHPEVAESLNNEANALEQLDRESDAEPLLQQALDMNRRMFKGDHPAIADSLNNLAHCQFLLGSQQESEGLFVAALEMDRRLYAGDHPSIADALNNLAYVRDALGRAEEAEPQFVDAIAMYRRLFDDEHPDVARCMANHARCLADLGRMDEALREARQASEITRRTLPEGHPVREKCLEVLEELETDAGP